MSELTIVIGIIALILLFGIVVLAVMLVRRGSSSSDTALEHLMRTQEQLAGQLQQIAASSNIAQSQLGERLQAQERALSKTLDERLADVTRRVTETLHKQSSEAATTMGDLRERLAVITSAQSKITELSQQVVTLQDVLANKQARGAFGEIQLIDIVKTALPPNAYSFQVTMGNGSRADCLLKLPNPPGSIVVDAKFPLESFNAIRSAKDDGERDRARKAFGADVMKHVGDISKKYIVPGETADSALMFLPSEAVYAELHAELPNIVERSHHAKVYIVSPTTMMATLNTIRAVLKDAQMKEQAGLIQKEVRAMAEDVTRLDDRVEKLHRHFNQAEEDIRQIRISTEKVAKRAEKIESVELGDLDGHAGGEIEASARSKPEPSRRIEGHSSGSASGQSSFLPSNDEGGS